MTLRTSHTWWTRDGVGVVHHSELADGRVTLALALGGARYAVVLTPAPEGPSAWRGTWTRPGHPQTGEASGRLYRAADGSFVIVGDWHEDGAVYRWVAELDAARTKD